MTVFLGWIGVSVVTCLGFHLALGGRRRMRDEDLSRSRVRTLYPPPGGFPE